MSAVRQDPDREPLPGDGKGLIHVIRPFGVERLDEVLAIEQAAYPFPWTRGNFIDSLAAGYLAWGRFAPDGTLVGYFLAMPGFEEMHLLNITVAARHEGRGHARALLDALYRECSLRGVPMLWLEVRDGNQRARALYRREGFSEAGRRRQYYPAAEGREDAVLMSRPIPPAGGAAASHTARSDDGLE